MQHTIFGWHTWVGNIPLMLTINCVGVTSSVKDMRSAVWEAKTCHQRCSGKKAIEKKSVCLSLKTNISSLCQLSAVFPSSLYVSVYMWFFFVCGTSIRLTPVLQTCHKGRSACRSLFVKSCDNRGITFIVRSLDRTLCVRKGSVLNDCCSPFCSYSASTERTPGERRDHKLLVR